MSEQIPDIRGFLLSPTVSIVNDETGELDVITNPIPGLVTHNSLPGIFPLVLEEGAPLPAIVYQFIDAPEDKLLSGKGVGIKRARVQLTMYAMSAAQCDGLCNAIGDIFNGYSGPMGDVTVGITTREDPHDEYESERKQFVKIRDVMVAYYDN